MQPSIVEMCLVTALLARLLYGSLTPALALVALSGTASLPLRWHQEGCGNPRLCSDVRSTDSSRLEYEKINHWEFVPFLHPTLHKGEAKLNARILQLQ